ncbi:trypsin-like peptidase domain-containing protein [Patescibacteria group bacterium]|nr:trypsin-like peptidase domain-containing protein [Patescibacteria group bacterium]
MKKLLLLLTAITVALVAIPQSQAITKTQKAILSTVLIYKYEAGTDKIISQGSGVFVNEDGWILTNKHVVRGFSGMFDDVKIIPTGANEEANNDCSFKVEAGYIVASPIADIALIIPPKPYLIPCKPISYLSPVATVVPTGTNITVIGYPGTDIGSGSVTVTSGKIAGSTLYKIDTNAVDLTPPYTREDLEKRTQYLKMDVDIGAGNSGGPVIDSMGRLVGISRAMSKIEYQDGIIQNFVSIAVPSQEILKEFPEVSSDSYTVETTLTDVSPNAWYSNAIQKFQAAGYLHSPDSLFRPGDNATRSEFISFIVDLLGGAEEVNESTTESFSDISKRNQYFAHFEKAGQLDLVKGAGNCYGTLPCNANPNSPINRAEAAILLLRAFELKRTATAPTFGDAPSDAWFTEGIEASASLCILRGDDGAGTVRPAGLMNRAEMAVMLYRLYQKLSYPVCDNDSQEANIPAAPSVSTDKDNEVVGQIPCTQKSWECMPKSTCSRKLEQMQWCELVMDECSNTRRAHPPTTLLCIPGGLMGMIEIINHTEAMLKRMETIILEMEDEGQAKQALKLKKQYQEQSEDYEAKFEAAKKYSDYMQWFGDDVESLEKTLEQTEEIFFDLPGIKGEFLP